MRLLLIAIMFGLLSNAGFAQNRQSIKQRNYDPATVVIVQGNITNIVMQNSRRGNYSGIHLEMQSSTGEVSIHVGPLWYLQEQSLVLNKGDKIQVEGSNKIINGKKVIIARSITKDAKTYELRTQGGVPLWSRPGK